MVCSKKYILFAGVNGAGKSTLFNLHPEFESMSRVNVDELVRKYGTWEEQTAQIKAGRDAVALLKQYLESGDSFNQETTLCGRSIFHNIEKAKRKGFEVEVHYIGIESSAICKERIRNRVSNGGHGIPDADVDRRYIESLNNIRKILDLCDRVYFYDNTVEFTLFAVYQKNKIDICYHEVPVWFRKYLLQKMTQEVRE